MAIDPQEFKRRRQQREQKRQQQRLRQRKTMLRLGIAAGVLILCAVLILVVTRKAPQEDPPVQTMAQTTAPAGQTQPEDTATQPVTTVHFAAAGDLTVSDAVVNAGGGERNYTGAFLDVAHIFADADISAVNFEGNLYGSPYGTERRSAPQSMAKALSEAGIDLVQLANSYAIHHGTLGLSSTIDGIRSAGMEPLGVYADQQAYRQGGGYIIRNVQGVRIAFVAFTKGMDGLALPAGSENCVNVLYTDYASTYQTVDTEGISAVLDRIAKDKPDITIALLHWGSEYNDTISASQKKIVTLMQEKGVDAIVGTHSHYVQKITFDQDTGFLVAYSLGDFFGEAQRPGTEYSVILDLEITKDNTTGVTKITNYSYTPTFTVAEADASQRVLRIREAMAAYEAEYIDRVSQETYEAMKSALERIEARITAK